MREPSETSGDPSVDSLPAAPEEGEVSRLARESNAPLPYVGEEPEPAVPEGGEEWLGELDEEVASFDDEDDCTTIIATIVHS